MFPCRQAQRKLQTGFQERPVMAYVLLGPVFTDLPKKELKLVEGNVVYIKIKVQEGLNFS